MKKIILLLFAWTTTVVWGQSLLTPELLWKMGRVSDPRLSPDGSKVVYGIRRTDLSANKGNSDLWLLDMTTGQTKPLCADSSNESSARWSGDGKRIYFLCDASGSSQLWSVQPDGSDRKQVSFLKDDINEYGVAQNGSRIWMTIDVKVKRFLGKDIYPDLSKTTGKVYDDLMFRHWDTWDDGTYKHIFCVVLFKATASPTRRISCPVNRSIPL